MEIWRGISTNKKSFWMRIKKRKKDPLGHLIYTSNIPFNAVKKIYVHFEIAIIDMVEYKMAIDTVKLDPPLHQIFSPRSAHLRLDT